MYMKYFFYILFFLFYQNLNVFCDEVKILTIYTSPDYPPFTYINNGKNVGFEVDLIKEIAAEMNYNVNIKSADFNSLMAFLLSKKADLIISGMNKNSEREKQVSFSKCYYTTYFSILTTRDDIKSINDFENKTIYVQNGTTMEKYLNNLQKTIKFNIKLISDNKIIIQELLIGRAQLALFEDASSKNFSSVNNKLKSILIKDENAKSDCYAIAFRKENKNLIAKIDEIILKMEKNGKLKSLKDKWQIN